MPIAARKLIKLTVMTFLFAAIFPVILSGIGWEFHKDKIDGENIKWWESCLFWPWLMNHYFIGKK